MFLITKSIVTKSISDVPFCIRESLCRGIKSEAIKISFDSREQNGSSFKVPILGSVTIETFLGQIIFALILELKENLNIVSSRLEHC